MSIRPDKREGKSNKQEWMEEESEHGSCCSLFYQHVHVVVERR